MILGVAAGWSGASDHSLGKFSRRATQSSSVWHYASVRSLVIPDVDNEDKKRSPVVAALTFSLFFLHLALSVRAVLTLSRMQIHPTTEWFYLSLNPPIWFLWCRWRADRGVGWGW